MAYFCILSAWNVKAAEYYKVIRHILCGPAGYPDSISWLLVAEKRAANELP
jgi:hypothetical protein